MKHVFLFCLTLAVSILCTQQIIAEGGSEGTTYTFAISSSSDPSGKVQFSGAYVAYDPSGQPSIQYIQELTPFEYKVSGSVFLGMFQARSEDDRVTVTLTKYVAGRLGGHATGTSIMNVVHGGPDGIGYGIPSGFAGLLSPSTNSK